MTLRRKIAIGSGALAGAVIIAWLWPLPRPITDPSITTLRLLDRNGNLLYDRRGGGLRRDIPLSEIPGDVAKALIATEDRTYWSHPGLSLRGITRALLHDIQAGAIVEGGSTITQQYVRTMLQPAQRGLTYKIREAWLALKVSAVYSKQELLERFLNNAYFGQQSYGIAAAAETYFGKDISQLSLGESALLVGLLNAPTSLDPYKQPAAALERRSLVLGALRDTGMIEPSRIEEARMEPLQLRKKRIDIRAPHFVMWQLLEREKEWAGKTEIRTTLDLNLQNEIETIVSHQLEKLKDSNVTSAAVVVLDARSGDILSMLGSADYFDAGHDGQVNSAVAPRQPGSAIKPFTYALGLAHGMTAATVIADIEVQYLTQEGTPYTPRNYDYQHHGLVRLREALANSYNIAAVKTLERVGVPELVSFLRTLGLGTITESPEHYGLALTLGDSEVTLLELARAYAIFPRGGRTLELRSALTDEQKTGTAVLDPASSWLIADILSDNGARTAEFGLSSALSFDFPVGAKTGTTRNSRDNWTIGFTPDRIVGVWVGNADNSPMRGTSGVTGAGPIFHDVMIVATKGIRPSGFVRPAGITEAEICRLSGKLMTPLCPRAITEYFMSGTEPKEKDDLHRFVAIDSRNGLLASPECDPTFVRKEIFIFYPFEVQEWARENGWKEPPSGYSPLCGEVTMSHSVPAEALRITSPSPGAEYLLDPLVPDDRERINLAASAERGVASIEWRVNGKSLGTGSPPRFSQSFVPKAGTYVIEAVAGSLRDTVTITVRNP